MVDKLFHHGVMGQPVRNYYHLLNRFPAVAACLSPDFTYSPDEQFDRFREYFEAARVPSLVNRMVVFETATSLQALLQVEDRTSMAWGLESRVPLLDHRLVEALMAIPPAVKFQGGELKHLLKPVAARTVPEEIVARKDKMGFPIPLGQWAQGPLRDFVTDTLTSRAARERGLFDTRHLQTVVSSGPEFDRALWGALCLELWFQQFVDSPVVGHV
jgi:asparagine synthase (glutamine-hydrolysing)